MKSSPVERELEETLPTEYNYHYRVYATNDNGNGRVITLGEYFDVSEIEIIVGFFQKDVIITIEEVRDGRS